MPDGGDTANDRLGVVIWLFVLAAMVAVMVVIGGLTRLTDSGLSMVDWRPVTGWFPPLGDNEWERAFEAYKQYPEYRKLNAGMTLADFKGIFWLEYVHRLWGRVIGIAFVLPFVAFLWRGNLRRADVPKLVGVFVLGAAQGAMGWYMVRSGLVDRPDVSQYRLVAHLSLALVILALLLWYAFDIRAQARPASDPAPPNGLWWRGVAFAGFVALVALSGGFVAGLDAGLLYNSFPLMGGQVIPPDYWDPALGWRTLFENRSAVQFHHRVLAVAAVATAVVFWWRWRRAVRGTRAETALLTVAAIACVQAALGIATLLLVVPVVLAALHQAGAVALFASAVWLAFEARPDQRQSASNAPVSGEGVRPAGNRIG